ncbi:MAG: histidine kinase [Pseudomonadota bacterium]|nr:histidine kinase [Pseudomonadota bacterium]
MTNALALSTVTVNHLQLLIEQEKTALAREIHDDLGGHLIATAMDLAQLRQRFIGFDPVALEKIERATSSLNAAVDMMRRVTEELHPTLLDNVGLFAALRWQIKHMCHRSSIACREILPEAELRLRPATAITLFRVGQEALILAENQMDATHVDFEITVDDDKFAIHVQVDGASSVPALGSRGDVALEFLRHRIDAMNGVVTVSQPREGGLRLSAEVHLDTVSTSETQAVRALEAQAPQGVRHLDPES